MRPARTLGTRELNRAYIARQLLAERAPMSALEAVEHLVGLQAQAPRPPYFGLWSRVEGFRPAELSSLLLDREAVRVGVMRGTVHLVSARDCVQLRPLTRRLYERLVRTGYRGRLGGLDPREVADAGLALLRRRPYSSKELATALAGLWPDRDPYTLAQVVRHLGDVVQIPPRGLWGRAGQPVYATAESWLGRPLAVEPCVETVVSRYLGAFGPASVQDAQTWSGLTGLAEVFARLRPQLRVFSHESGRELYDLPEAPRPDPGTPLPVRYVAEYDNLVLSHADRTRVISDPHRRRIASRNGQVPGTILIDGMVRGMWRAETGRGAARLTVTPFEPLDDEEMQALTEEGERLLAFASEGPYDEESRDHPPRKAPAPPAGRPSPTAGGAGGLEGAGEVVFAPPPRED